MVAEFNILYVIGYCVEPFCFRHHCICRYEDELSILVHELLDEPWASHAINFDAFSGDPSHVLLLFSDLRSKGYVSASTRTPPWAGEIT